MTLILTSSGWQVIQEFVTAPRMFVHKSAQVMSARANLIRRGDMTDRKQMLLERREADMSPLDTVSTRTLDTWASRVVELPSVLLTVVSTSWREGHTTIWLSARGAGLFTTSCTQRCM